MMKGPKWIALCLTLLAFSAKATADLKPAFELITLGDSGGIQDGNLSAFLLRASSNPHYIALDTGTLVNGINVALQHKAFAELPLHKDPAWQTNGIILRHHIKAYLISHGHLDHVAGMLISSPQDSKKPIYALPSVNQTLVDTYFNWQAWANFTDRGKAPRLNQYSLIDLKPQQTIEIQGTDLKVTPFSLSHPLESTVFIIENKLDVFVYFGDTGPDAVEKQGKLAKVWRYLSQQLTSKTLRAMVLEVSFDNDRPDNLLFGHLTPKWLLQELAVFHGMLDDKSQLEQSKIIISHIKYSLKAEEDPRAKVLQQLQQGNHLNLQIILAKQGQRLAL